ncbi:MAG: hypothetical protein A2Z20_09500 [Bdellovibrionales bacterium RBG_16_40_8]|nr:MAG: hypothetical protein A2Z20_09500 [Bdellovibrionales bacterium RBG_16_40_8]
MGSNYDAALKQDLKHVDSATQNDTIYGMSTSGSGRRQDSDDRRIIDRVSNPHIRMHMGQLKWCLLIMTIICGGASLYNVIRAFLRASMSYSIILSIVFFIIAFVIWRYYQAVLLFLQNESVSNLDRLLERQSIVWVATVFFSVVFSAVFFIFR